MARLTASLPPDLAHLECHISSVEMSDTSTLRPRLLAALQAAGVKLPERQAAANHICRSLRKLQLDEQPLPAPAPRAVLTLHLTATGGVTVELQSVVPRTFAIVGAYASKPLRAALQAAGGWREVGADGATSATMLWTRKASDVDSPAAPPWQLHNHFRNVRELVTKRGLACNLRMLAALDGTDVWTVAPPTYCLSDTQQLREFLSTWALSRAASILRRAARQPRTARRRTQSDATLAAAIVVAERYLAAVEVTPATEAAAARSASLQSGLGPSTFDAARERAATWRRRISALRSLQLSVSERSQLLPNATGTHGGAAAGDGSSGDGGVHGDRPGDARGAGYVCGHDGPAAAMSSETLPVEGLPVEGLPVEGLPVEGLPVEGLRALACRVEIALCWAPSHASSIPPIEPPLPAAAILPTPSADANKANVCSNGTCDGTRGAACDADDWHTVWIVKPEGGRRGEGIAILTDLEPLLERCRQERCRLVAQRYVPKPHLILGLKYDVRVWALVTSINPLVWWAYDDYYLRFASAPYPSRSPEHDLHTSPHAASSAAAAVAVAGKGGGGGLAFAPEAHLTNHCVQVSAAGYGSTVEGNMWSRAQFLEYLASPAFVADRASRSKHSEETRPPQRSVAVGGGESVETGPSRSKHGEESREHHGGDRADTKARSLEARIVRAIHKCVGTALLATSDVIEQRARSFELIGFDILLDCELRPWLLEANSSPSAEREEGPLRRIVDEGIRDLVALVLDLHRDQHTGSLTTAQLAAARRQRAGPCWRLAGEGTADEQGVPDGPPCGPTAWSTSELRARRYAKDFELQGGGSGAASAMMSPQAVLREWVGE